MTILELADKISAPFKSKKIKAKEKNILPLNKMMEELGVMSSSVLGSYHEEENPDNLSISDYVHMQNNDGTVRAIVRLFSMPIQATRKVVIAGAGDNGEKDFIETVFLKPELEGGMSTPLQFVIADMTRAIVEGFRAYEKVPKIIDTGLYSGKIGWQKLAPRDAQTVKVITDEFGGFNGVMQKAMYGTRMIDIVLPKEKCMLYTFQKERNYFYGESILKTAWYHYDKKHKLYYLAHKKAELDAIGLKKLKILKAVTDAEVTAAESATDDIGLNSRITLPPGFDLEVDRASSGYDVLPLIEHHDREMVLSTLTQMMNMGASSKYNYTYGSGYEYQAQFITHMLNSIMSSIEDTLNTWAVAPLIDFNFGTGVYPKIKLMPLSGETEQYMMKIFSDIIRKDPSQINPEVMEKITNEVSERLGVSTQDIQNNAVNAFEKGKRKAANEAKMPAPTTSKKKKEEIKQKAMQMKDSANFIEFFEQEGVNYLADTIKGLNV